MPPARETIQLLRSQSLGSVVRGEVERRVLEGDLNPGERVNENALAAEFSVSRGPVREACRALAEAGLLTFVVNRGFFVREVTDREVIDVYEVRAGLMRLAGELVARRIAPEQVSELAGLVSRMDEAAREADFDAFYGLNLAFHDRTVAFTGNARLHALYADLVKELHLYRRRSLTAGGGLMASNAEHREIVEALRSRDGGRAARAMEGHILAGKARFLAAAPRAADLVAPP